MEGRRESSAFPEGDEDSDTIVRPGWQYHVYGLVHGQVRGLWGDSLMCSHASNKYRRKTEGELSILRTAKEVLGLAMNVRTHHHGWQKGGGIVQKPTPFFPFTVQFSPSGVNCHTYESPYRSPHPSLQNLSSTRPTSVNAFKPHSTILRHGLEFNTTSVKAVVVPGAQPRSHVNASSYIT
jgi:hypothetical protein